MSNWPEDLDRFLRTDPRDAGCDTAMQLLHIYAELTAADPPAAQRRYPEVAAHLRSCGPCEQDLNGLLAAITADADIAESLQRRGTSRRAVSPRRQPVASGGRCGQLLRSRRRRQIGTGGIAARGGVGLPAGHRCGLRPGPA